MMTSPNKSRPVYAPLDADPRGTEHWFITSGATDQDRARAVAALSRVAPLQVWVVQADAPRADADPLHALAEAPRRFDSEEGLLAALEQAMRDASIGVRIYALGSEPFIWSVHQLAARYAIAAEAVRVAHSGGLFRRVYCVHCRALNERVTSNVVACAGCGRHLFVRDHFSRRLAAFMGVQADAEMPGELPEREQIYT
ncbi:dimethylamine monooxygenase subunit DmmA family protein [Paraburkholderia aromaticivorans]|uniref:dimethylamine monooxygenase subunit DmmA family protein n=1 Tax=Paraburkholderia aromaticivorans TaxID=2026199 RepID=UPI001F0F32D0|nr:dimethylamine monooxygenase subunit DmmA family protein [Paraburkholderia aromaticivorans]